MGEMLISSKAVDDHLWVTQSTRFNISCFFQDFHGFNLNFDDDNVVLGFAFDTRDIGLSRGAKQINNMILYLSDNACFGVNFPDVSRLLLIGDNADEVIHNNNQNTGFLIPQQLRNLFVRNNCTFVGYNAKLFKDHLSLMGIEFTSKLVEVEEILPKGKSCESVVLGTGNKKLRFDRAGDIKMASCTTKAYLAAHAYIKLQ